MLTFALEGLDKDEFSIDVQTGVVSMAGQQFALPLDADSNNTYEIEILALDDNQVIASQKWKIEVTDALAPVFTSIDTLSVDENQSAGITLVASDASAIRYSISGGDAGDFSVDAMTGEVLFLVLPDYESKIVYQFQANATDTENNIATQNVTIHILDILAEIMHNGFAYGTVVSPNTAKVWLDRNLTATKVCSSLDDAPCFGGYFQWGRNQDGHERFSSFSVGPTQLFVSDNSQSTFMTTDSGLNYDWAFDDSNGAIRVMRWSSVDGSSVCPVGFRVPQEAEFLAELSGVAGRADAFNSFLKIPSAGYRLYFDARYYGRNSSLGCGPRSLTGREQAQFRSI